VGERAGSVLGTGRAGFTAGRGIAVERRVTMAVRLTELGTRRFIGDTETMIVHDRWNSNCEDCLMNLLIEKGTARGFNPDQSDQAFWEDYEYCPHCFDRSDPEPPAWALGLGDAETISTGPNGAEE